MPPPGGSTPLPKGTPLLCNPFLSPPSTCRRTEPPSMDLANLVMCVLVCPRGPQMGHALPSLTCPCDTFQICISGDPWGSPCPSFPGDLDTMGHREVAPVEDLVIFSLPCRKRTERNVGYLLRELCKVKIHGHKVPTGTGGSIWGIMVLCVKNILDGCAFPWSSLWHRESESTGP